MSSPKSAALFEQACKVIPGGVNSPVRAFKGVGGDPKFISKASGPYIYDVDDNQYIDYVMSWGPMIHGHNAEFISEAVSKATERGLSFGAPTELEVQFAKLLTDNLSGVEQIRMLSSGTEATLSAIRLARGYTKRDRIIKLDGCYHGHGDSLLVSAGSGVATFGIPGSPGVPEAIASLTSVAEFNDVAGLRDLIRTLGGESVAAIILEPVPGNMGLVLPKSGYLESLREICNENGILLIFDEVMSGFRVAFGGAAEKFGVTPDLLTYGKVIGGGLPVGALAGKEKIMNCLAPTGEVYQAGTLSGNPLAMAAGYAAISKLLETSPYSDFEELAKFWAEGMKESAKRNGIPLQTTFCGSMLGFFFSEKEVSNYSDAKDADQEMFKKFFHEMLERGIYLAPSAFEAGFLSTSHTREVVQQTIDAADSVFKTL